MDAVGRPILIDSSDMGLPLPCSLRKRATNQLKDVARDFKSKVLPVPLLSTNTVIFEELVRIDASGIQYG